jgi:hypothetical protein
VPSYAEKIVEALSQLRSPNDWGITYIKGSKDFKLWRGPVTILYMDQHDQYEASVPGFVSKLHWSNNPQDAVDVMLVKLADHVAKMAMTLSEAQEARL